ncbi:MAG: hypothetical protein H7343_14975 [Undibacterium sp.]|nr:hypothetical protein [Opitutaceae bacterium]
MNEQQQLTQLCERLGAPPAQAATMAAQLLKRAEQLATERGRPREEMLGHLLRLMVKGRAGEVPADFPATQPPETSGGKAK